MTHFAALNRHGKLSVLGRVSPAAAPACDASTKRELFFPPHLALTDRLLKNFPQNTFTHVHTGLISTDEVWTVCHSIRELIKNKELIKWKKMIIRCECCSASDKDSHIGTQHEVGT